jgi:hypothetical protein
MPPPATFAGAGCSRILEVGVKAGYWTPGRAHGIAEMVRNRYRLGTVGRALRR